ncbi:RELT-like protein 2 [Genypterus blacodes]|uniref:RELT-like protein 2 n=1 Tax=Genypterus blacodes TaxID=154954 RepID=UPI003F7699E7
MTNLEASGVGDAPPPYMIFVVVFLFFVTGLLGFLICHLLKKKGYRCRTGDMDDEGEEEEEEEKQEGNANDEEDEENQDTVEQILKCIIENEANMEAFKEMLGNQNVCVRHDARLRKESVGGIPPHLHTVHSGSDHNSCHLCAQSRSKKNRRQSRTPRSKQRPGEQTVFAVGRFRVTHTDKKVQGGPNPLVGSGDHLDQPNENEERKESVYNLRNMFRDVPPSSETSKGNAPNVGKRRKSLTIFGLRRGSDPTGMKGAGGTAVKFAVEQQPVVLEEPSQSSGLAENPAETETIAEPAQVQEPGKTSGSTFNSPSSPSDSKADGSGPVPEFGSTKSLTTKHSTVNMLAPPPSSLPISSPASSAHTYKMMEKHEDEMDKMGVNEGAYNPGPLQTSTPISLGFTPGQSGPFYSVGLPTLSGPSSSPDLDPGFGGSLALISVGSSPASSFPIQSPSSISSLKTPPSPLAVGPIPKLSLRNTTSGDAKIAFSPTSPSPTLSSVKVIPDKLTIPSSPSRKTSLPTDSTRDIMQVSLQTPSSCLDTQNVSRGRGALSTEGMIFSPSTSIEGASIQKTDEMKEIELAGILKTEKLSPTKGEFKDAVIISPSSLSKDRLSTLSLSPSSQLSPSSPIGSRASSVSIIKASPDSKRDFSVVTMVEEEETGDTPRVGIESEKLGVGPAESQAGDVSVPLFDRPKMTLKAGSGPTASQDRDDMMQMEDIRACKVTQVEEREKEEEQSDKREGAQ